MAVPRGVPLPPTSSSASCLLPLLCPRALRVQTNPLKVCIFTAQDKSRKGYAFQHVEQSPRGGGGGYIGLCCGVLLTDNAYIVCCMCCNAPCNERVQAHGCKLGRAPCPLLLILHLPSVNMSALYESKACCVLPLQVESQQWWQQLSQIRVHRPWMPHPALGGARVEGPLPKALLRPLLSEVAHHAQVTWLLLVILFQLCRQVELSSLSSAHAVAEQSEFAAVAGHPFDSHG